LPSDKFSLYEPKINESNVNILNKVKGLIWFKFIYMVF
jgi:hypothetical protein